MIAKDLINFEGVKLTAKTAIRNKCLECSCWSSPRVKECPCGEPIPVGSPPKSKIKTQRIQPACPLWPYRLNKGRPSIKKTIRKYCLWCMGEQPYEVNKCPSIECPLYKFRMGNNPNYSEEAKEKARQRLKERGGFGSKAPNNALNPRATGKTND